MRSSRQGLTTEKCKTKAIQKVQAYFMNILSFVSVFRHNQAYSGIIQEYSGIFRTLCNPAIFRTLTYSEPEVSS